MTHVRTLTSALLLAVCIAALPLRPAFALATIFSVGQSPLYSPQAISAGGFRAQVFGAPSSSASTDETLALLSAPGNFGNGPLKAMDPASREGGRLVFIFNGSSAPSETACTAPESLGGKAAEGNLHVIAIYCLGNRWLARGALSGIEVSGPQDPAYVKAMQNLLTTMLPMKSPDMPNGTNGQ